ncbi:MAG: electron transfer flavoprotein subunit alpha/FixB family protein [Kiritimatiellae bacterium]|nr:electron transfer flavoprotein subunit alpha/FixB family protein [Kiritimatiellia bacterium]
MPDISVFVECDEGVLNDVSLQCLGAARALAAGGKIRCLAAGSGVTAPAASLFALGADEVAVCDDPRLAVYTLRPYRKALTAWLSTSTPALVLFGATTLGNDLAPSVAAAMKAACALSADGVEAADGGFQACRVEFDRKVKTAFAPAKGGLFVVSLRDGAAAVPEADASKTGAAQPLAVELNDTELTAKVLKRAVAKKTVNLKDAKIIVAAGAGVGNPDGLAVVRQLADALGAEVGATRAVVDAGWLPADHQIGQTGATVRPDLYIACGISGAVQHRVGMMDARKIIAINTDANAPIFKVAHYQIVGDLKVVIPKLIKTLAS